MKLNLTKPLIVFDLETTGLDMIKDRIIQISYIKVMPDGTEDRKNLYVNPCKEIPAEVVALTGISNEDVKDAPTFKQLASTLEKEFTGCDFAGYNSNHFDVPMLAEEFLRAGIDFDFNKCRLIDAQTIFMKMERRNLAAAYKFYCGRKMEEDFEAHRADQDTEATYRVLMGELDKYAPGVQDEPERVLNNNMDELADFSKQKDNVDFAGRIVWEEVKDAQGNVVNDENGNPLKHEVFNFGKYKGWDVAEILTKDPGYFTWVLGAGIDFDFNKCRLIDAQTIFMKMERRNLAAAYKFYCGRKMEEDFEAHRADQDTEATYRVLMGELDKYAPGVQDEPERVLNNNMDELADFSKQKDNVDFAGRIVWEEVKDAQGNVVNDENGNPLKHEVFNFGKYKGWDVAEILTKDPGYFTWVLGSDFTNNTKQVLTRIRLREFNKRMGK
jgi:DNA polymerase III subunit epsilon